MLIIVQSNVLYIKLDSLASRPPLCTYGVEVRKGQYYSLGPRPKSAPVRITFAIKGSGNQARLVHTLKK